MLKKMIGRVWRKRQPTCQRHPMALAAGQTAAAQVIRRLAEAGFEAYLVGGAVRDLLLEVQPKDFDVATDAPPEAVRKVFRRSRIIGRRFPIVHVMVGAETVEVSTFRSGQSRQNELGRIVRDNHYGTVEQDAVRRDFTCNALYYDLIKQEILDFHHGMDDIRAKRLVMIGEPALRYQEDPVRILRAVRLSGKLGFSVDEATAAPVAEYAHLLQREPVSRLFDELMKLLFSGHAAGCLKQLHILGVGGDVHPLLTALQDEAARRPDGMTTLALAQTDRRIREGLPVSAGFVLAALLWHKLLPLWQAQSGSPAAAMTAAVARLREDLERGWGVPQRYSGVMREIWALQPQFAHMRGARPFRLLAQPRFRAAYDFLLLRAQSGEAVGDLAEWWTAFQAADAAERCEMTEARQGGAEKTAESKPKKKRRRRRKKPAADTPQ